VRGFVTNATSGTIAGYGDGIQLYASTLLNAGVITGRRRYGALLSGGGVISNASTGTIIGGTGISVTSGGTVYDAGTIGGAMYAVRFSAGHVNRLVLAPGYHLGGIANGGDMVSSTLELASAASSGTIHYLGLAFRNFGTVAVDAGATWDFAEGPGFGTPIDNTIAGTLINDGGIVLDPSTLHVGDLLGNGSITIQSGSTLEVTGTIAASETIVFQGANAYLHLDDPTHAYGSVVGFAATDGIDLKGIDPASVSGGLTFGAGSYFPLDAASPTPIYATASSDGALVTALCFLPDTLIQTPSGRVKVRNLAIGDIVSTFGGGQRPVRWIGNGAVLATSGRRGPATPVIIRKHAFAPNVPSEDLHVTKGHAFWFDGVLIPVEFLVNHRSIVWDDRAREVALFHVELDAHDVLIANGAPAESYRDDGNRWLFRNANSGWGQPAKAPCAPVLTGGPIVDATWRRLLDRSGLRPAAPLTDAADVHLVADGQRIDPAFQRSGRYRFRLRARPTELRIASRAAAPQELGLARDPRVLGVALRLIVLSRGIRVITLAADDARLTDGFHGFEPELGLRWTDGWARVPAALFEGFDGPVEVELQVTGTARYVDDRAADCAVA
jgi:hypothetical protein